MMQIVKSCCAIALSAAFASAEDCSPARLIAAMPESVESIYIRDVAMLESGDWNVTIQAERQQATGRSSDLATVVRAAAWAGRVRTHALAAAEFVIPDGIGASAFDPREVYLETTGFGELRTSLDDPASSVVLERIDRDGLRVYRGGPDPQSATGAEARAQTAARGAVFVCFLDDHTMVLAPLLDECVSIAASLKAATPETEVNASLKRRWGEAAQAIEHAAKSGHSPLLIVRAVDAWTPTDWIQRKPGDKINPRGTWPPRDSIVMTATNRAPIRFKLLLFGGDYDLPSSWLRQCLGLNRNQVLIEKGVLEITSDPFTGQTPRNPGEAASILWIRPMMVFGDAIAI